MAGIDFNHDSRDISSSSGDVTVNGVLPGTGGGDTANFETLSGDKTLTNSDVTYQFLDPNGASRQLDLPAEEADLRFIITNTGQGDAESINVRDDASSSLSLVIAAGNSIELISDGTNWFSVGPMGGVKWGPSQNGAIVMGGTVPSIAAGAISIGNTSEVVGSSSIAIGNGADNTSGSRAIALGYFAHARTQNAICIGYGASTTSGGTDSISIGFNTTTNKANSVNLGQYATATRSGELSMPIEYNSSKNSKRGSVGVGGNVSVASTPTELLCAATTGERLVLATDTMMTISGVASAYDTVVDTMASYEFRGCYANVGGTLSEKSVSIDTIFQDTGFSFAISADNTNKAIKFEGTQPNANETRWAVNVTYVEVLV